MGTLGVKRASDERFCPSIILYCNPGDGVRSKLSSACRNGR